MSDVRACFLHDGVMRHVVVGDTGVCDCGEAIVETYTSRQPEVLAAEVRRLRVENARLQRVVEATEFERDVWAKKVQEMGIEINALITISRALRTQYGHETKPPARRGRPPKTMT